MHAHEKQIQIKIELPEEPLLIECDSGRIMQVIVNLVGNAVKFSPKKGIVQVGIEAIKKIPEAMPRYPGNLDMNPGNGKYYGLVTVTDFGAGIPDSEKEQIFERFHQVKKDKKIAGQGVGLGLAISRTIVEAHHGAIWVEDNPGGGSRFRLLLRSGSIQNNESPKASGLI
jgi:signal transduction histidine kinase